MGIPFEFESVTPASVAAAVGTPAYVLSRNTFRKRLDLFADKMRGAWTDARFFYSMKANANPWIVREALARGWGIDACSEGDLWLAKKAGATRAGISFAGVGVSRSGFARACREAEFVNLCTPAQVAHAANVAEAVGIRISPDATRTGHAYVTTKFGFSTDETREAIQALRASGVRVRGLHVHCGSSIMDENDYLQAVSGGLLRAVEAFPPNAFAGLEYVNIGGGLGIEYDDRGGGLNPSILAEGIGGLMSRLSERAGHRLQLHCEPGEWVVGPCGALLMGATAAFRRPDVRVAIVDGSLNQFMGTSFFNPHNAISNVSNADGALLPHDVFGATNSPMDVFCRGRELRAVREGDLLVLHCAAAYGYARGGRFNEHLQAPEVMVDGTRMSILRTREDVVVLDQEVPSELSWFEPDPSEEATARHD